jgi:hypothetical protein
LDHEDSVIVGAVLRGIADPASLEELAAAELEGNDARSPNFASNWRSTCR